MRKWWRFSKKKPERAPSEISPLPEPEISLPDSSEARRALAKAKRDRRRGEELATEIHQMLDVMKTAREDNHFAESIVEIIKRGR